MLHVIYMLHNQNIVQTVCCCASWWAAIVLICIMSTGLLQAEWLNILVLPELSSVYLWQTAPAPLLRPNKEPLVGCCSGRFTGRKEARRPALLGWCALTLSVPLQQCSFCGFSWHRLWHRIHPNKRVTSHQETFNFNLLFHLQICCKGFRWANSVKASKPLFLVLFKSFL